MSGGDDEAVVAKAVVDEAVVDAAVVDAAVVDDAVVDGFSVAAGTTDDGVLSGVASVDTVEQPARMLTNATATCQRRSAVALVRSPATVCTVEPASAPMAPWPRTSSGPTFKLARTIPSPAFTGMDAATPALTTPGFMLSAPA